MNHEFCIFQRGFFRQNFEMTSSIFWVEMRTITLICLQDFEANETRMSRNQVRIAAKNLRKKILRCWLRYWERVLTPIVQRTYVVLGRLTLNMTRPVIRDNFSSVFSPFVFRSRWHILVVYNVWGPSYRLNKKIWSDLSQFAPPSPSVRLFSTGLVAIFVTKTVQTDRSATVFHSHCTVWSNNLIFWKRWWYMLIRREAFCASHITTSILLKINCVCVTTRKFRNKRQGRTRDTHRNFHQGRTDSPLSGQLSMTNGVSDRCGIVQKANYRRFLDAELTSDRSGMT